MRLSSASQPSASAAAQLHQVGNVSAEAPPLDGPRPCQSQQQRFDLEVPSDSITSPSLQASVTPITLQRARGCKLILPLVRLRGCLLHQLPVVETRFFCISHIYFIAVFS